MRTTATLMLVATTPFASSALAEDYSNHTLVLGYAEYITDPSSGEAGRVEWLQKDLGNGQLEHDFVYNDPRATWDNVVGISYGLKSGFQSADANLTDQLGWFRESVEIWNRLRCSNMNATEVVVNPGSPGLVANFFNTGVLDVSLVQADITQVGFLGIGPIFPTGTNTLGVTYTLFWTDEAGNLTDIDGNGKIDTALREIYYNDQYEWADNGLEGTQPSGVRFFDFPTVAIHEAGHGVSSAHFGSIGVKDGFLFAKPRAVMNAIYGGTLRQLTGRDDGSHCSNWAQWPNN